MDERVQRCVCLQLQIDACQSEIDALDLTDEEHAAVVDELDAIYITDETIERAEAFLAYFDLKHERENRKQ